MAKYRTLILILSPYLGDKFNAKYGTVRYGTVRYRINLIIYVRYFTSRAMIFGPRRRPHPLKEKLKARATRVQHKPCLFISSISQALPLLDYGGFGCREKILFCVCTVYLSTVADRRVRALSDPLDEGI